ncbi:MAG: DMT family transporter [Armatimonadia bacterium]
MSLSVLLLVLCSAVLHAFWNFLAKKARDQVSFMFLMMAVSPIVWLGPLIWMLLHGTNFGPWYIPVAGGLVQATYLTLMGKGYSCGDLSHVYPLSRGLAPAIIAVAAWPLLGERLTEVGGIGIGLIVLGSLVLSVGACNGANGGFSWREMLQPASRMAVLAAVGIAAYHMLDKAGSVRADSPLAYLCLMHLYLVAFLTLFTFGQRRVEDISLEWRANWKSALIVMVVSFVAYFMIVTAMKLGSVAYVASLRNIGLLFGVILGAKALKEQGLVWRASGTALMLVGIFAIALGG